MVGRNQVVLFQVPILRICWAGDFVDSMAKKSFEFFLFFVSNPGEPNYLSKSGRKTICCREVPLTSQGYSRVSSFGKCSKLLFENSEKKENYMDYKEFLVAWRFWMTFFQYQLKIVVSVDVILLSVASNSSKLHSGILTRSQIFEIYRVTNNA